MSSLSSLNEKFLAAPASAPFPSLTEARFADKVMADLDGDGRGEVLLYIPDPTGLSAPSLGVLSYFDYSQIDSKWSNVGTPIQLVSTALLPLQLNPASSGSLTRQAPLISPDQNVILFFDNVSTLSILTYAAETGYALLSTQTGQIPPAPGQSANWTLAANQFFLCGDFDGDGVDEAVIYDSDRSLGLLKWSQSAQGFTCQSSQSAFPKSYQPGHSWSLSQGTVFWVGDVNNDGRPEVLALTPGAQLAALGWNKATSQFEALSLATKAVPNAVAGSPSWPLASAMRLFIADLDGDGLNEILGFQQNGDGALLGVMKWDADLGWPVVLGDLKSDGFDWAQSVFVGSIVNAREAAGKQTIGVFDPALNSIHLYGWYDEVLHYFSIAHGVLPASQAGSPAWALQSDNVFALSDVDGDGHMEVIVQSDSAASVGVLKWAGGALQTLWLGTVGPTSVAPLQNWGFGLIYNAPVASFTPFTEDQSEIYEKINQEFGITLEGGIRAEYLNSANKDGVFADWKRQIADNWPDTPRKSAQEHWPWVEDFSVEDVRAVFSALEDELSAVEVLYGVSDSIEDFFQDLQDQRTADIGTVISNLDPQTPPPSAQVSYWPGQLGVAALWGLAAAVGALDPVLGIVTSMAASIFGSIVGQPSSDDAPGALPGPTVVQYADLMGHIANDKLITNKAFQGQVRALLQDPVKLRLIELLSEGPWPMSGVSNASQAIQTSKYNRFYYYQLLMPTIFVWTEWRLTSSSSPWILTLAWTEKWEQKPLIVDGAAPMFWQENSSLFMLRAQGSTVEAPALPSDSLIEDLFTTLALDHLDLIGNLRNWKFSIIPYSMGDDVDKAHFYITNASTATLKVTIEMPDPPGRPRVFEVGEIEPGGFYVSQDTYYWPVEGYTLVGNASGPNGEPWNAETKLKANLVDRGATASVGNWLTFVEGPAHVFWWVDNPGGLTRDKVAANQSIESA